MKTILHKIYAPNSKSLRNQKLTYLTLLLIFCSFIVEAQQWVSFGNSTTPKAPEITLISATNQQVVFTCETFGFYQSDIVNGGITYQNINMPGVSNLDRPGYPNLPIVNRAIAYSGKISPSVTVSVLQQLTFKDYTVYPAPDLRDAVTTSNFPYLAEVFSINNQIYSQDNQVPLDISAIVSSGQFRDQQFISVVTNPLQWNPTTKRLTANVKCTVTVNLSSSSEDAIVNTGMFETIAKEMFLNYPKNNEPKNNPKTKSTSSSYVQYYTLTQASDADNIVADYLIITDQQFFEPNNPNSELRRIAAHRANYNGYVVAVISAQNIMSDAVGFPYNYYPQFADDYKYKNERRLRECIKRIYDNGLAPHTYDGHLGFVLFVGDAVRDDAGITPTVGIPGSHDPYDYWEPGQTGNPSALRNVFPYVTDYYYSMLTTKPGFSVKDDIGDLYVGRFSVDNTDQLHNIIEKTINYETDYDFDGWKNKSFFFNSKGLLNPPNNYVYHYLTDPDGYYNSFIPSKIGLPYTYDIKDMYNYSMADEIPTVMTYFNRGQAYNSYYGHSHYYDLGIGGYNGQYLTTDYVKTNLTNDGKFGFMFMNSCDAGMYDLGGGAECFAEELTRYSANRGFIGIVAASSLAFLDYANTPSSTPQTIQDFLIMENYSLLAHNLGESLLLAKIKKQNLNSYWTNGQILYYNLIGDPGLNLRSQGYSVSKNTTLDPQVTISGQVHVLSGVTLTIPNNCNLYFGNNGRLIIDEGAFISFDDNAYFHGMVMENALEIRGGIKTKVGSLPNISFDAPAGMSCSGIVFENANLDAAFNKLTFTRSAIFANNLKSLTVESPSNNRSSFNFAPLFIKSNNLVLRYCDFTNLSSIFCTRLNNDGVNVYIRNCNFTSSSTQPTNQYDMIYISGYQNFDLQANAITFNSGDAISLYNSGMGTIKNIKNNIITFSGPTYYQNNGIKIFQSNAIIETNKITNAKFGISLFNNIGKQVQVIGNSEATASNQTQQIYNNTENQVFSADAGSFPYIFKYNYINNTTTKALVYCNGINIPAGSLNVRCNNWGSSFIPSQDLYPFAAYTYLPIWTFNGICAGKSMAANNYSNPKELIYEFKAQIVSTDPDSPENIAMLTEISEYMISNNTEFDMLNEVLSELIDVHSHNLLGECARKIKNQLYISKREFDFPVNDAEQRLDAPISLADSVYASIELAHTLLQSGNGRMIDSKVTSLYQNLVPSDFEDFYSYKSKLVDLLYPQTDKSITTCNDMQNPIKISISPNPASNLVNIEFNQLIQSPVNVQIVESTGRIVYSAKKFPDVGGKNILLNTNEIADGFYLITIKIDGKQTVTNQIIISR